MQKSQSASQLISTINHLIGVNPLIYKWIYCNPNFPDQGEWEVDSMTLDRHGLIFKCIHPKERIVEISPSPGYELRIKSVRNNRKFKVFYQEDEGYRMLLKSVSCGIITYVPERVCDLRLGCINRETHEMVMGMDLISAERVNIKLLPVGMDSLVPRDVPANLSDYVSHYFLPLI